MKKLTDEEKYRITELSKKGYSSRQIAKEMFGDKNSRKSTISDYIFSYKNNLEIPVKIAFLDIETAPSSGFYFGHRYDINISQDQVISESFILTYSIKFNNSNKIICSGLTYDEVKEENDYRITKELHEILNDVNIVIGHNIKDFDNKIINTRLLFHGFTPPIPYKIIDTLLIARKVFRFPSNKLDSLCKYLGIGEKFETGGFKLWKGYMNGDEESMEMMMDYNAQDVMILEELYKKIRAWDSSHPNLNLYSKEKDLCPCCGYEKFENVEKKCYTSLSSYDAFRCLSCGKIFRSRIKNKTEKITFIS